MSPPPSALSQPVPALPPSSDAGDMSKMGVGGMLAMGVGNAACLLLCFYACMLAPKIIGGVAAEDASRFAVAPSGPSLEQAGQRRCLGQHGKLSSLGTPCQPINPYFASSPFSNTSSANRALTGCRCQRQVRSYGRPRCLPPGARSSSSAVGHRRAGHHRAGGCRHAGANAWIEGIWHHAL